MFNQILQKSLVLIFISIICLLPQIVSAKTFVNKSKGCNYSVLATVFFDFQSESAQYTINQWQKDMTRIWNSSQAKNLSSQCQINYSFDLKLTEAGKFCADYSDHHCIKIVPDKFNVKGDIATTVKIASNSGRKGWGEWTSRLNGAQAAHEVGHLMGLGDEYHYEDHHYVNDNYQLIGSQSIMAQTWGDVTALNGHSQGIIKQAGFSLPVKDNIVVAATINQPKFTQFYKLGDLNIYHERPSEDFLINSLVRGVTDPKVYYVDNSGSLRWVPNEAVAQRLFGLEWNKKITWFSDAIIYTYAFGNDLE